MTRSTTAVAVSRSRAALTSHTWRSIWSPRSATERIRSAPRLYRAALPRLRSVPRFRWLTAAAVTPFHRALR